MDIFGQKKNEPIDESAATQPVKPEEKIVNQSENLKTEPLITAQPSFTTESVIDQEKGVPVAEEIATVTKPVDEKVDNPVEESADENKIENILDADEVITDAENKLKKYEDDWKEVQESLGNLRKLGEAIESNIKKEQERKQKIQEAIKKIEDDLAERGKKPLNTSEFSNVN